MEVSSSKRNGSVTPVVEKERSKKKNTVVHVDVAAPTKDRSFVETIGKWLFRKSGGGKPLKTTVPVDDAKTRCSLTDDEWKHLSKVVKVWLVDLEELVIEELVGVGTFGTTFRGILRGEMCAVKKVRVTSDSFKQFVREVEALSAIDDANVVGFKGVVVNQELNACWIIQEFMSGGNLNDAIRKNYTLSKKATSKKLQILRDVAKGMAALQPATLHRDLKPSNIFLDETMTAKIGDLGLAKKLLSGEMTGETGTYLYMAPEVILHCSYNNTADVWSWGATMVEVLTCKFPYQDRLLTPIQIATEVMKHKMRPELPESHSTPALRDLLDRCCSFDPKKRPMFGDIVTEMDAIIEQQIQEETAQSLDRSWSISNLFEI